MTGSGFDSELSRSIDWDLVTCRAEEEMVIRMTLRRFREEARARQRSDSFRRESIASTQMRCVVATLPEAVRSVWHLNAVADAQPLR